MVSVMMIDVSGREPHPPTRTSHRHKSLTDSGHFFLVEHQPMLIRRRLFERWCVDDDLDTSPRGEWGFVHITAHMLLPPSEYK